MKILGKRQEHYYLQSNKQNIKTNQRKQLTHRHRNDHSIEAKSPIKIPPCSLKKDDLTFRLKTSPASRQNQPQSQYAELGLKSEDCTQTLCTLTKDQLKEHLNTVEKSQASVKEPTEINQYQCQLIDNLWEICNRLRITQNSCLKEPLDIIHIQIRKMISLVAENSTQGNAPLASSKKIKLQNCIAHSHCEKQNYEQDMESDNLSDQFSTSKQLSEERAPHHEPESSNSSKKSSFQSKGDLEIKKIMYMLESKQKMILANNKGSQPSSDRIRSERLSSFSSFNQNSSEDSGLTVFQIQRCSDISSQCSQKETKTGKQYEKMEKKLEGMKSRVSGQSSFRDESQSNDGQEEVGNKRKVLNDIVAMLNQKYNKNIKLE